MHNYLQVNQPAIIINVENHLEYDDMIGKCVTVIELMSLDNSRNYFTGNENIDKFCTEPYAIIRLGDFEAGIRQRYLMPIPPLDDHTEIESKLILTPESVS